MKILMNNSFRRYVRMVECVLREVVEIIGSTKDNQWPLIS